MITIGGNRGERASHGPDGLAAFEYRQQILLLQILMVKVGLAWEALISYYSRRHMQ